MPVTRSPLTRHKSASFDAGGRTRNVLEVIAVIGCGVRASADAIVTMTAFCSINPEVQFAT
jgi:hypothetical protein